MTYILGVGSFGNDVRRLQEFLNDEFSAALATDGSYGGNTKAEVLRFRRRFGLPESPTFDDQCFAVSAGRGFAPPAFDRDPAHQADAWPRKPSGLGSPSAALMQQKAGRIEFVHAPIAGNAERIRVTNDFEARNIVTVDVPQLRDAVIPLDSGVTKSHGRIRFHKDHAARVAALFKAWDEARLMDRVLTYDGSFNLRLKRGARSASPDNLSNHSWGTAFDINAHWNGLGATPALMGARGCLREMVAIANAHGFAWGGHFRRRDGMHFEVAAETL